MTLLSLLIIPFLFSCEKTGETNTIAELNLSLSKTKILNDGQDKVDIFVFDENNKDVTGLVNIYINQVTLSGNSFSSKDTGIFIIQAGYENITSNTEEVQVVEDKGLSFVKNILVEQFTGTWCGWCPRAIYNISNLMEQDSAISHVAYHLNDQLSYSYNSTLFEFMGYTGVPTVSVDRSRTWEGNINDITSMHKPQRVGINMSVAGSCTELKVTVSLKFGQVFTEKLALMVYVVHDNLIADQANYYNDDPASFWYQKGATMKDFVHENVMSKTATDFFGDLIPGDSIDIGSVYKQNFSISSFRCNDIDQIEVVAFVVYKSGSKENTVLNSMVCAVGESRDYELAVK